MARPPQYPGFEEWLSEELTTWLRKSNLDQVGGAEIRGHISQKIDSLKEVPFEDGAAEAFHKNVQRFLNRMEFLEGNGAPHSGYSFTDPVSDLDAPETSEGDDGEEVAENDDQRLYGQTRESFLHLPAQLILSRKYSARVRSMPSKLRNRSWANPDLIFVRESVRSVEPELRELVDFRPPLILTSCELKYFGGEEILDTDFYKAVAEARAGGRWANETMLVFLREKRWGSLGEMKALPKRLLNFAETAQVGVLEMAIIQEGNSQQSQIVPVEHLPPTCRLEIFWEDADGLTAEVVGLIEDYQEFGSPVDQLTSKESGEMLLGLASESLKRQRGFSAIVQNGDDPFERVFAAHRDHGEVGKHILSGVKAIFATYVEGQNITRTKGKWWIKNPKNEDEMRLSHQDESVRQMVDSL